VSSRHDRLALLDRYLRIPTISRQVTHVLRHFFQQTALYADVVASRPA